MAACASTDEEIPVSGQVEQPDTLTQPPVTNAVYLRTSSSLVHNAIDSYGKLLGLGVISGDDDELVRYVLDQQTEHAKLLEGATADVGGEAFSDPNPSVATNIVEPALAAVGKSPEEAQDVLRYVNAFETLIAATLQGYTPNLTEAPPRELMMRIAAVDNRHAAVVASRIDGLLGAGARDDPGRDDGDHHDAARHDHDVARRLGRATARRAAARRTRCRGPSPRSPRSRWCSAGSTSPGRPRARTRTSTRRHPPARPEPDRGGLWAGGPAPAAPFDL